MELLDNLIEDLHVLKNSWRFARQTPDKIARHFTGIVGSALHVARENELLEPLCGDLETFVKGVTDDGATIKELHWQLIFELMDLVRDSLQGGSVNSDALEQWKSRMEEAQPATPAPATRPAFSLQTEGPMNGDSTVEEEYHMEGSVRSDVEQLLQRAQEALAGGNSEDAKEFALHAAQLIAKVEAEEAKKKEKTLRTDLEMAILEESEAEETLRHIQEEMNDRTQEIVSLNDRLSEAQASFEQRSRTCQELKSQIDQTETELASLRKKHKDLLEEFQQALPARDAAERECSRLKEQFDKLAPETQTIEDNLKAAEGQLARARQKREHIETQLEKVASKISA
jgi:predicted  nucleic acid-binding Zn-ribbon protein